MLVKLMKILVLNLTMALLVFGSAASYAQQEGAAPQFFDADNIAGNPSQQQESLTPGPESANSTLDIPPLEDVEDEIFFDANELVPVPQGEMVPGAPRKVDPRVEPGSKFIVVKENFGSESREAKLVSAQRAIKLGRFDAAINMLEDLRDAHGNDPGILLALATAYQKDGQREKAISIYERVAELKPDNVAAQVNLIGLVGEKYPSVALRRLVDLREKHPDHVALTAQIGVMQAQLGMYREAMQFLGQAAAMEPQNANHLFNMAVVADRAGESEDAINYYEQALEADMLYSGGNSIPREAVYERLARLR